MLFRQYYRAGNDIAVHKFHADYVAASGQFAHVDGGCSLGIEYLLAVDIENAGILDSHFGVDVDDSVGGVGEDADGVVVDIADSCIDHNGCIASRGASGAVVGTRDRHVGV